MKSKNWIPAFAGMTGYSKTPLVLVGLFQPALALANSASFLPVPTLGDFGLIGLTALVAGLGAYAMRNRK